MRILLHWLAATATLMGGLLFAQYAAASPLGVGCLGGINARYERAAIARYARSTGAEIVLNTNCDSAGTGSAQLLAARLGGAAVDGTDDGAVQVWASSAVDLRSEALSPWDDLLKPESALSCSVHSMPRGVLRLAQRAGRIWGIPYKLDGLVMGVQADLFAASGLNLPADWDWATFAVDAEKLTSLLSTQDRAGRGALLPPPWYDPFWHAFFLGNASAVVNPDGSGAFESAPNLETIATLRDWFASGSVGLSADPFPGLPESLAQARTGVQLVWASKLVAQDPRFWAGGAYTVADRWRRVDVDIRPVPIPHPPGRRVPTPLSVYA